jgi:hypothetical protein
MPMTILIAAFALLSLLAVAALAVRTFLRVTEGTNGLRARIERLFRLPERTRDRTRHHYYQPYWRPR